MTELPILYLDPGVRTRFGPDTSENRVQDKAFLILSIGIKRGPIFDSFPLSGLLTFMIYFFLKNHIFMSLADEKRSGEKDLLDIILKNRQQQLQTKQQQQQQEQKQKSTHQQLELHPQQHKEQGCIQNSVGGGNKGQ